MSVSTDTTFDNAKRKQWMVYKFASNWEFLRITTACTFSIHNFFGFSIIEGSGTEPTIIHHLICFILIGLPLNYMQVLLGQYSQLGVIFFKNMCPAGHGLGYASIINSLLWCTRFGIVMSDFFVYLLACIDLNLKWMACPPHSADRCWDVRSKCEKNCISQYVHSSAYIYWKETFLHNVDMKAKHISLGVPIWTRVVPLGFTWSIIYLMVNMGIDRYKKVVRFSNYMIFASIIILILVCFTTEGAFPGVALMFRINFNSFISPGAWCHALNGVVQLLALSRACHMTFGSYMTPDVPSDLLTIISGVINFSATFLMSMLTYATTGIIMANSHSGDSQLKYIWKRGHSPFFTVLPQGLGFLGIPQLWTILYFLVCLAVLINNLTTQMDGIQRSIGVAFYKSRVYHHYILVGLCIFCSMVGFLFSSKEGFVISTQLYRRTLKHVRCFDMFLMCVITFWIYRVHRICDDIHFMRGYQPTKFWKICWYLMPCIVVFEYVYITLYDDERVISPGFIVFHYLSYFVLVSPIPLCIIYQILKFAKMRNLVGIMQPEERWGPPDPEERRLRRLFNPRQETRSRRRNDACQHNCLLRSKYLQRCVKEEKNQRRNFFGASITEIKNISEENIEFDVSRDDTASTVGASSNSTGAY